MDAATHIELHGRRVFEISGPQTTIHPCGSHDDAITLAAELETQAAAMRAAVDAQIRGAVTAGWDVVMPHPLDLDPGAAVNDDASDTELAEISRAMLTGPGDGYSGDNPQPVSASGDHDQEPPATVEAPPDRPVAPGSAPLVPSAELSEPVTPEPAGGGVVQVTSVNWNPETRRLTVHLLAAEDSDVWRRCGTATAPFGLKAGEPSIRAWSMNEGDTYEVRLGGPDGELVTEGIAGQ
jgi:hypothetical protein